MTENKEPKTCLELLREPFPANQISKLPKPTKQQNDAVKADYKKGIRCTVCGGWHHKDVIHLDYVGHAALTDRLLDVDPHWFWEPVAFDQNGLPALDKFGGLWIRLTVAGHTRLGYGGADGKNGTDAVKELIGDALRNAAMRFGAALDLWHKGDLHAHDDDAESGMDRNMPAVGENAASKNEKSRALFKALCETIKDCKTVNDIQRLGKDDEFKASVDDLPADWQQDIRRAWKDHLDDVSKANTETPFDEVA